MAYTGTHDTDTLHGLVQSMPEMDRHHARVYFGCADDDLPWALLRSCWQSPCHVAVAQLQDVLMLPRETRMNVPGTVQKSNWAWRASRGALTLEGADRVREQLYVAGRVGSGTGAADRDALDGRR